VLFRSDDTPLRPRIPYHRKNEDAKETGKGEEFDNQTHKGVATKEKNMKDDNKHDDKKRVVLVKRKSDPMISGNPREGKTANIDRFIRRGIFTVRINEAGRAVEFLLANPET